MNMLRPHLQWMLVCCLLATLSGCSVLDRIQTCNFACKPNCGPNLASDHTCEQCSQGTPELAPIEGIPVDTAISQAMHAGQVIPEFEEIAKLHEQLDKMSANDASMQEQLALMDRKNQHHAEERQRLAESINELSSQLSRMESTLENHKIAIDGIESSLVNQHNIYETVLTSVEEQLGAMLDEGDGQE